MTSIADGAVRIQTSADTVPSTPAWFGEVALMTAHLRKHNVLTNIVERVRFARRRFGHYDVIDFLAVLFGYALSGERTLEAFYERLQPFAVPFMAWFGRERLPARSTLSRFLAALTEAPVEALRALFLDDLFSRPLTNEQQIGGLMDRMGGEWVVFDLDGTRDAARQRALPKAEGLSQPFRRLDDVCAAGYTGRKRGEVVRTRTVVSQAHSSEWLGSFGNCGNGRYRTELRQGLAAITRYLTAHQLPKARALLRLDGGVRQPNRAERPMNQPQGGVVQMTERLTRWWWLWLVAGILWVIASLIILQFSTASLVTVGVIFGVLFLVAGIQEFFLASVAPSWKWLYIVLGIFFVFGGIYALVHPLGTFVALADMLGFLFLLVGVFWTIEAFATRSVYDLWFLGLIAGIMMIVLGFWTGGQFIATKASTLLIFVGIWTLFHGITDIIRAFRIKHLGQQASTLATS